MPSPDMYLMCTYSSVFTALHRTHLTSSDQKQNKTTIHQKPKPKTKTKTTQNEKYPKPKTRNQIQERRTKTKNRNRNRNRNQNRTQKPKPKPKTKNQKPTLLVSSSAAINASFSPCLFCCLCRLSSACLLLPFAVGRSGG